MNNHNLDKWRSFDFIPHIGAALTKPRIKWSGHINKHIPNFIERRKFPGNRLVSYYGGYISQVWYMYRLCGARHLHCGVAAPASLASRRRADGTRPPSSPIIIIEPLFLTTYTTPSARCVHSIVTQICLNTFTCLKTSSNVGIQEFVDDHRQKENVNSSEMVLCFGPGVY